MRSAISQKCAMGLMFGMLIAMAGPMQAEELFPPAKEYLPMLSTSEVIEHNKRLLFNTSIGEVLKNSTKIKARHFYSEAGRLFKEATQALMEGQEETARKLANKSIENFYQSDMAHYGLSLKQ
jgi:hypothetical protein